MVAATAPLHPNQAPPRLRLVQPPLDVGSVAARWRVAFDAADSAIAASTPVLTRPEVAVRRERLRLERRAVAAELGRFARVARPKVVEPGAPGGVAAVRTPGSLTTTSARTAFI
jgi:hypothetical protein